MKKLLAALALLATALSPLAADADTYPSRPVKIIVPYAAGGTVDLVARVLAQQLSEQMGQPFIVDNRAGASGMIGSEAASKAAADGYTLLLQSPTLVANALMSRNVPYKVTRDFTPVALLGSVPMVLLAYPGLPVHTLQDFVAAAKAQPKAYSFGTSALGSPMHVALEAIKAETQLQIPVVAYRGTAPALNDVLGGQVSAIIDAIPSSYPHITSGKLRALAVTSKARVPLLPDVPTVAESGLPGFELVSWYGLWGPAKLPPEIASRLAAEAAKAMKSPLAASRLGVQGFTADGGSPQDFGAYIAKESATYERIVKKANIHID